MHFATLNHVECFDAHLQLIKDKEECLSQLVAEANALVLKQRSLSSDLIRVRRERQEHIDSYRSVFLEQQCVTINFINTAGESMRCVSVYFIILLM